MTNNPLREAALDDLRRAGAASERESELLRQSGERIYALSRRAAAAEREIERLRAELQQAQVLMDEIRRTRDVLSAQVSSLLSDRDREYEERAELRRLLASLQSQLQAMLTALFQNAGPAPASGPLNLLARRAGQRGARPAGYGIVTSPRNGGHGLAN